MRKRKINQELFELLRSGRWNDFTVAELKAAYMALANCPHRTEKAAWQFVYRNIERMEAGGIVSRLVGQKGEKQRYQFNLKNAPAMPAIVTHSIEANVVPDEATLSCLKEKLHRYKVEMLTAIGETEEYDSLCKELPHMRDVVQTLYNDARDRCSKILGRVKALESILANRLSVSP